MSDLQPDVQARAEALDRAETASDPFSGAGSIEMSGAPSFEQFRTGSELGPGNELGSQVPGLPDQILPGADNSFNMGALSKQVGLQSDNMRGLNVTPFPDVVPGYDVSGFDALRGVVTQSQPATLENEQMYLSQGNLPSNAIPEQGDALLSEYEGE